MLHEVVESGTGIAAKPTSAWAAGKTGTTQSYRDAWFVGFAEDISCAVWVGYREGQVEMGDVHGITGHGRQLPCPHLEELRRCRRGPLRLAGDTSRREWRGR